MRLTALTLLLPGLAAAAGGSAEAIVIVADPRRYGGIRALCANLYNESHLLLAAATIVTIPALGLLLGRLTDLAMSRTGINLKSRILAEH